LLFFGDKCGGYLVLDFEGAKQGARERWLFAFDNEPGGPQIVLDDKCEEYEWGWMIYYGPSKPEEIPVEDRRPWGPMPLLVDRVTGSIQTVSTSGPNMPIVRLLSRRPASCQSPDVTIEEVGEMIRVSVSRRAFTPLRDLQNGAAPTGSITTWKAKTST
jgi:hypothetical protein